MSTPITPAVVRDALLQTRSKTLVNAAGWEPYFAKWAASLNEFGAWYHRIFHEFPDPLALLSASPAKGAAFWELDTLRLSVVMKVVVWRILIGCEIAAVHLAMEPKSFRLTVRLRTPYGQDEPEYESQDSEDMRLLRHLGTVEVDGVTQFQGYYAFA